jgi:cytochrome c biogenesis protein CcmG, thiol:disulfide interchange protein DsbE
VRLSRKILAIVGLVCIALISAYLLKPSDHPRPQQAPALGTLAPDFSLLQLTGQPLELSAYREKVVLLDFWATWCDPCRDEIPHFIDLQNKYGQEGLQIIGVSMDDSPEPVLDFSRRFKMNYPVVMGNAKIGELYGGILGLPVAFVIGRDGRVFARHIGAIDMSVVEREIGNLLAKTTASSPGSARHKSIWTNYQIRYSLNYIHGC